MKKAAFLIGRLVFGGFFLYNGIEHFRSREKQIPYAAAKGVPAPEVAVPLSGVPLIVGGASIIFGVKPKVGALALLGFLAAITPIMHDFWRNEDPNERMGNFTNFFKNLALAGGALALLGVEEPWEASVPVDRYRTQLDRYRAFMKARKIVRRLAA